MNLAQLADLGLGILVCACAVIASAGGALIIAILRRAAERERQQAANRKLSAPSGRV